MMLSILQNNQVRRARACAISDNIQTVGLKQVDDLSVTSHYLKEMTEEEKKKIKRFETNHLLFTNIIIMIMSFSNL
jgi:hypothetical protein